MNADAVHAYFKGLQQGIVSRIEALDGGAFRRDAWQRPDDRALEHLRQLGYAGALAGGEDDLTNM